MGNKGITTATLDHLLGRLEVVHMDGVNYRKKVAGSFKEKKEKGILA
ncbi:hypothetical protein MKY27_02940 [Solibacillus sp. FSL R5-0449]